MSKIFSVFISSIIMILTVYIFGLVTVDNKKDKKLISFILIILSATIHTVIYLFLDGTIKTISLCILYSLFLSKTFHLEYSKAILASILFVLFMVIPDLITTSFFILVLKISKEQFYTKMAGSIICSSFACLIFILLSLCFKKILRKIINYNVSYSKNMLFMSFLVLLSVGIFFYMLISKLKIENNIISYLIVIITLIFILISSIKQKIVNDKLQGKYDELLEIMKTYEMDVEEQRTIIHETENEIMTIRSKIQDKESEEVIIKYIESILGDKKSSNSMRKYAKFKYLPSNGLKGFFYYKFMEAERKKIKVSVNIAKQIEDSFLSNLDVNNFKQLVRIIGVYLDNAIEASYLSKDKKLGIEVYLVKNNVEIIISNTFENKIDKDKIGQTKFSTKGKNRGHGLLLVNSILKNSNIFESKREIIGNLYIQKLVIKKINRKVK